MRPNELRLAEYVRSGHRNVEGWLSTGAVAIVERLAMAQANFEVRGHMAEIGVFRGKLFILLDLFLRDDERAVAVDTFEGSAIDFFIHDYMDTFLKNLERYGRGKEGLRLVKKNSTTVTAEELLDAAGGRFRLFSVDGGHDADTVYHDMTLAVATLADGGVIIADDYFNEEWPGVSEGINRLYCERKMEDVIPFAIGGNKVLFTQARHAARYIDYLTATSLEVPRHTVVQKFREFFHERVVTYSFREVARRGLARTILSRLKVR